MSIYHRTMQLRQRICMRRPQKLAFSMVRALRLANHHSVRPVRQHCRAGTKHCVLEADDYHLS